MIRNFSRAFGSLQTSGAVFNLSNAWKRMQGAVRAPRKHIKRILEPSGQDFNPLTNTTEEAFDEVAQEWQALIVNNPYDVNTFNMLEGAMIGNFGTVDNPHVVFTSDAPFRYVGCSGPQNEDDYEGHELMMFMLREGPLQRCPSCGQVFKLVRLRNEFSPEMDYYLSNLIPYEMQEMGEMDQTINMSLARFQKDSYEHSQFEVPSTTVYSLVNPDEHDRLLTDPAYRLERSKKMEEKLHVYVFSLQQIEKEYEQVHGPLAALPLNKVDYETLIECEKAIMKLDRHFRRVQKFETRKFIDRENHERREKRMLQRSKERWENNYTIFLGERSEEEQKFIDYFETDLEKYPDDENIEEQLDIAEIFARGDYDLKKYDFQEGYTRQPEEDASSYLQKKIFKFKYRIAGDAPDVYQTRQERMVSRQLERFRSKEYTEILANYRAALESHDKLALAVQERAYLDLIAKEAVQQYRDYYEDDKNEDFRIFDNLSTAENMLLIQAYENQVLPKVENNGFMSFPKRSWNTSSGLWANFFDDFADARQLLPTANRLSEAAQLDLAKPMTDEEMRLSGVSAAPTLGGKQERIESGKTEKKADAPKNTK